MSEKMRMIEDLKHCQHCGNLVQPPGRCFTGERAGEPCVPWDGTYDPVVAEREILGKGRIWRAANDDAAKLEMQRRFLSKVLPLTAPEAAKITETEDIVAWSEVPINDFLKSKGMDIQLDPLGPDTFAFAAYMKVMVQWLVEGEQRYIFNQKLSSNAFPAARLSTGFTAQGETVKIFNPKHHSEGVATLTTRSSDLVHITKFDKDIDPIELNYFAADLLSGATQEQGYDGVLFPFTDLNVQPDVSWMLGMWTKMDNGKVGTLVQALQQCKLRMNHKGAVVEDAAAGAVCFESCAVERDLVIDDSFLFVLERPGCALPVFSAVVRPDSFKDPGDLGF